MNNIEVKILNPDSIKEASKMMVCAARLTQSGHKVASMNDFIELYNKPYTDKTVETMTNLPHPTIQRFSTINLVIVGASRRFLAQITRTQVGVTFMSASLQYSDYSGKADFVIPYDILEKGPERIDEYIKSCEFSMHDYEEFVKLGVDHDACGYMAPQGLRNVLIISANPSALKHMISQRSCKRNTKETQYVMLKVWEELYKLDPIMFSPETTGPFCMQGYCKEGKMTCGSPFKKGTTPGEILDSCFPLLRGK